MMFDWSRVLFAGGWTQEDAQAFMLRVEALYRSEHP